MLVAAFVLFVCPFFFAADISTTSDGLVRLSQLGALNEHVEDSAEFPAEQQSAPTLQVMRAILTATYAQKVKMVQPDDSSGSILRPLGTVFYTADGRSVENILIVAPFADQRQFSGSARAPPQLI